MEEVGFAMMIDNVRYYNIAGVNISIKGERKYTDAFGNYFQTEEVYDGNGFTSLSIIIMKDPADVGIQADFYSLSGKISFNDSEYCVKKPNLIYSVSNLFSDKETTVLRLCYTGKKAIKTKIGALLLPNNIGINNSEDELVDSVMNYEVFWYIFAIILMKQRKIFLHSSMIERNGDVLVLAGTGGCGKTSTLLDLMEKEGYRYLAEDFGVLGCDGIAYYTPKKMAIYQSDAKFRNPDVMKALKALPYWQQVQWKLLIALGKNPRYRFAPQQLFCDSRIVRKGKIKAIVYMSRICGASVTKTEISQLSLCRKIRHASFRELKELGEILNNIRAVGDENVRDFYPDFSQIENKYEQILTEILAGKDLGILNVPLKTSPKEITNNIMHAYFEV